MPVYVSVTHYCSKYNSKNNERISMKLRKNRSTCNTVVMNFSEFLKHSEVAQYNNFLLSLSLSLFIYIYIYICMNL